MCALIAIATWNLVRRGSEEPRRTACGPVGRTAPSPAVPGARGAQIGGYSLLFYPYPAEERLSFRIRGPGYPTLVAIFARDRSAQVTLEGYRCRDGKKLRFWFRPGKPFRNLPVSTADLERSGDLSPKISFAGHTELTSTGAEVTTGYANFSTLGRWAISIKQDGETIGSVVIGLTGYSHPFTDPLSR